MGTAMGMEEGYNSSVEDVEARADEVEDELVGRDADLAS